MANQLSRHRAAAGSEIVIEMVTKKDGTNACIARIFDGDTIEEIWCKNQMPTGYFDLTSYVMESFTAESGTVYRSLVAYR